VSDPVHLPTRFRVRYFDPTQSRVVDEAIEAQSEAAARAALAQARRVVLELQPEPPGQRVRVAGSFDVAWWCRELRTLLKAGMTVVEALETLQAQSTDARRRQVQQALLQALREGQALSRAMRGSGAFSDVLVASVAASERTSTLVDALDDYLRYDEMLRRLRRQAVSAAIYPAVVVALGAAISLFLLLYVVPRFSSMYTDAHRELSPATHAVLWLSATVRSQFGWVVGALAGGVLALLAAWRSGWIARGAAALVAAIGPLDRRIDTYRLAKFYQSLALMFRGGYTLDEAMEVTRGLDLGPRLAGSLEQARRDISRGRSVSASMSQAGLTDAVTERLLAVGERTGAFDNVLQTIADRHAEDFATFVERATRIVEPLLLLLVALVVGGIVVMMYMPVFDIANSIRG
jgi:general secretion pathway protein F